MHAEHEAHVFPCWQIPQTAHASFFNPVLLQLSLVEDNRMGKPVTLLVKKYSKHQHEIYVARSPSATFLPVAASRTAATSAAGEETDRF